MMNARHVPDRPLVRKSKLAGRACRTEIATLIERKRLIGWREWLSLPDLGIGAIRAKVDTGATTSALHATDIMPYQHQGESRVRFFVFDESGLSKDPIPCSAAIRDERNVKSSTGQIERRHVIATQIWIGDVYFTAEVTLSDRAPMGYNMLLGRNAMRTGRLLVHPSRSYLQGRAILK